jgi:hypothetical protein
MVYDLYSRRRRRELQQEPDVYQYDEIPEVLRGQIAHIWTSAMGPSKVYYPSDWVDNIHWTTVRKLLCRERGLESLGGDLRNAKDDCLYYIKTEKNVDLWLDLVEISFDHISTRVPTLRSSATEAFKIEQAPDAAIAELNERFRLAAFGYRFENHQVVRIDSELIHAEIVKPSLALLSDKRFSAPQGEYLTAHGHYRAGHFADAVTNANNAFESAMKVICDKKGWQYNQGDRASDLVKIMRKNGLLPDYTEKAFDAFLSTLQHGLPAVRNNAGGHGKGNAPATPQHIAAYAMHLAAANIVLLVEAFQASEITP